MTEGDFVVAVLNDGRSLHLAAREFESLTTACTQGRVWWEGEDLWGDPVLVDLKDGLVSVEYRSAKTHDARRSFVAEQERDW